MDTKVYEICKNILTSLPLFLGHMAATSTSRRRVLTALGAGGVLGLAGCLGNGDDDGERIDGNGTTEETFDGLRIGVLGAFSGENGPEFGHQGLTGLLSGFAYKESPNEIPLDPDPLDLDHPTPVEAIHGQVLEYTVDGETYELHVRDCEDDPRAAERQAIELITQENVDVLFGVSNSDGLIRVANTVVNVHEVPLLSASGASTADATANEQSCSELLYRSTETSAMRARAGARYIVEDPMNEGLERVSIFVADFSFGRSVRDNYRTILEQEGIDIHSVVTVSQGHSDWHGHIDDAEENDVDVIVYGFTATTGIPFFRDFTTDEDGDPDIPAIRIIGDAPSRLGTAEMGISIEQRVQDLPGEFEGLTLEDALSIVRFGPFTTGYMWNQYDNPINQRFVEGQRSAYGVNPDLFSGSAFTLGSAIVQAVDEQAELSTDAIIDGLRGMEVADTPKGHNEYVFQEYNNQARSPITVSEIEVNDDEYWPAPIRVSGNEDAIFRVDKDDVAMPADEMSCDLG